jgi:hypothetical protein
MNNNRDELDRAAQHLDRAQDHAGDAAHHTKEAMEAGASGVLERTADTAREAGRRVEGATERTVEVAKDVGRKAGHVADGVIHAEADARVESRTGSTVEKVVHGAGNALQSAAPAVGRGAEAAVKVTGAAVSAISGVLGTIIGKIAGRVGGWWNGAAEAIAELPEEEHQACLIHFESYTPRPAGVTFETALPAYAIGYVAARNPDYRGRRFDDIEGDLRHGLGNDYDNLRDFSRYGYERGTTRL